MTRFILFLSICISCHLFAQANSFASLEETTKELQPYTLLDAWQHEIQTPPLTREILLQSLEAARAYYLNQQKTDGNFKYLLDLSDGKTSDDDNQVRQAGAIGDSPV